MWEGETQGPGGLPFVLLYLAFSERLEKEGRVNTVQPASRQKQRKVAFSSPRRPPPFSINKWGILTGGARAGALQKLGGRQPPSHPSQRVRGSGESKINETNRVSLLAEGPGEAHKSPPVITYKTLQVVKGIP